jgi:hypothetical protein
MNPRTVRWVIIITVIAMVALFVSALASGTTSPPPSQVVPTVAP